ncbi:hypothetical protein TrVE_jg244 [Triparma verrucosa]|uniref:DCD domain-containing protein n=1 Tax=Triparma verrucosa TaxID=1606542 RepID=A0A9W7FM87_9STRA|nr:hypothetical protein TrVE_jg244 [Triparma verrucosa]
MSGFSAMNLGFQEVGRPNNNAMGYQQNRTQGHQGGQHPTYNVAARQHGSNAHQGYRGSAGFHGPQGGRGYSAAAAGNSGRHNAWASRHGPSGDGRGYNSGRGQTPPSSPPRHGSAGHPSAMKSYQLPGSGVYPNKHATNPNLPAFRRSPKDRHQLKPYVVAEIVEFVAKRFECKMQRDFEEADNIQEFLEQEYNIVVHDALRQWWYRGDRPGNVLTVSPTSTSSPPVAAPAPAPSPSIDSGLGLTGVGGTSLSGVGGTSLSGIGGLGFGTDFSLTTPALATASPPGRKGSNPQGASLIASADGKTVPTVVAAARAAWVFNCTEATRVECVQRRLFGCPAPKNYERMNPGDIVYLSNVTQRTLEGPFLALTSIMKDIVPEAWAGRYMWQVSVDKLGDNIIRVSRDEVSKITGYGNNRSRIYYFNEKQHRQVLMLLTERGYKDGCGDSVYPLVALKALSLNEPNSTPVPAGGSVALGTFDRTLAARENMNIPPGQPMPATLRAWIIEVCSMKKGQEKVNCGYVGDQVKKRFGSFDFNVYPPGFARLHEFVQSLGFIVEVIDKHPYVHTKFDHLANKVDPTAISPSLKLKMEQQRSNAGFKNSISAANHAPSAVVADSKPPTLAIVLKTMNEILLAYDDRKVNSGQMNDNLKKRFPAFNHQEHGYAKFHEFCKGVGFKVIIWNGHPWVQEKD